MGMLIKTACPRALLYLWRKMPCSHVCDVFYGDVNENSMSQSTPIFVKINAFNVK